MENLTEQKLIKVKRRVAEIKKFYKHIVVYILVNLFLAFIWKFSIKIAGDFIISNRFDGDNYTHFPIWLIWGFFLVLHAIIVFGFSNLLGKDWEARKINKFMKE